MKRIVSEFYDFMFTYMLFFEIPSDFNVYYSNIDYNLLIVLVVLKR